MMEGRGEVIDSYPGGAAYFKIVPASDSCYHGKNSTGLNFPMPILLKGERMPQILVAQNIRGIILAAENRAVALNEKGEEFFLAVNRLVPLSSHCALVAAGAAEGIDMANSLRNFIQGEGVEDVQDLYALPCLFSLRNTSVS
jgi:hypothetical protein